LAAAKETDRSWKYINLSQYMCVGIGRQNITYNSVLGIRRLDSFISGNTYINGNQTFVSDSHWPFICSVGIIHSKMSETRMDFKIEILLKSLFLCWHAFEAVKTILTMISCRQI
jgi:hypothetical protein